MPLIRGGKRLPFYVTFLLSTFCDGLSRLGPWASPAETLSLSLSLPRRRRVANHGAASDKRIIHLPRRVIAPEKMSRREFPRNSARRRKEQAGNSRSISRTLLRNREETALSFFLGRMKSPVPALKRWRPSNTRSDITRLPRAAREGSSNSPSAFRVH